MKKFVVFVAFLSLISCKESTFTPQPALGAGQLLFIGSNQSDCRDQIGTKSNEYASITSTKFDGDNLTIIVKQKAFCSSKFDLKSTITGNSILLKSDDTSKEASRCMCSYDLTYNLSGAKSGLYKIDYEGNVYNNETYKVSTTATK